jgi:hypothetical protein
MSHLLGSRRLTDLYGSPYFEPRACFTLNPTPRFVEKLPILEVAVGSEAPLQQFHLAMRRNVVIYSPFTRIEVVQRLHGDLYML